MGGERIEAIRRFVRNAALANDGGSYRLRVLLDMAASELERERQAAQQEQPIPGNDPTEQPKA